MPQTAAFSNSLLGIDIAAPPDWEYTPGDTVIGSVSRSYQTISPDAEISVRILGRSKSKIREQRGQSHETYRSRVNFFALPQSNVQRVLHKGPLHMTRENMAEAGSWPFSITLPEFTMIAPQQQLPPESSYLSLEPEAAAEHVLPESILFKYSGFGISHEAYVEYYIEATFRHIQGGSIETHIATKPIRIRRRPTAYTLAGDDFKLVSKSSSHRIKSKDLLPPPEQPVERSLRQKTAHFFTHTKSPVFWFNIHATVPTVLQLSNPNPIPIKLLAEPNFDLLSPELKDLTLPVVMLERLVLEIKTHAEAMAPGNWTGSPHTHSESWTSDVGLDWLLTKHRSRISIPWLPDNKPLNVGVELQANFTAHGLKVGDQRAGGVAGGCRVIQPSFVTYGLKRKHTAKWMIQFVVAGERMKLAFSQAVEILPEADEQPPPTFDATNFGEGPSGLQDDMPPPFESVPERERKPSYSSDKKGQVQHETKEK